MDDHVVLEWNFSPPDYFEGPISLKRKNYLMTIENGKVQALIEPGIYGEDHKMRDELHDTLNNRFLGVQLLIHKPYELSNASVSRLLPDGRKVPTVFPESCVSIPSVESPDLVTKDKDGKITSDSKKERVQRKENLAELAEKYAHKDNLIKPLLKSYNSAVLDPDNELVHLYEIRDAMATKFGNEHLARKALGISRPQWSRFRQLANDEPLTQGRHRGRKVDSLRDATEEELIEARKIALDLILGYFNYLYQVAFL